jgi:hypothetical protein
LENLPDFSFFFSAYPQKYTERIFMAANHTRSTKNAPDADSFLLAEYTALRDEVLKRVELQQQILSLTLVVFGSMLTFGLQAHAASILLLYPILAVFLASTWRHDGRTVMRISVYIRDHIEARMGGTTGGWEHRARRQHKSRGTFMIILTPARGVVTGGLNFLSARGVFAGTALLATLLAIPFAKADFTDILLFALAIASILGSMALLRYIPMTEPPPAGAREEHVGEEAHN